MVTHDPPQPSRVGRETTRRPTTVVALPSPAEIRQAVGHPQIYLDALRTVLTMVRQSLFSGATALCANVAFTQGLFLTGKSPAQQSHREFLVATVVYVSFFLGFSMLTGYSAPLVQFRHTSHPAAPKPYVFWLARVLRASIAHYVASLAVVIAIGYAYSFIGASWQQYQLHFYAVSLCINYYTAALDVLSRRVYQTETVEGLALGYVNQTPLWRRLATAYCKDFHFVLAAFVSSGYIHVSSRLQITSELDLVAFSLASMSFRFVLMKITRRFVLGARRVHARLLFVVAAVPTVLINTQVRIALLRVQANVSMTSVVVLALIEPVMRLGKVWRVRVEIQQVAPLSARQSSSIRPIVGAPPSCTEKRVKSSGPSVITVAPAPAPAPAPVPVPLARSTTSRRKAQQFVQRLLQFTAAEIHADMCSEYIAIACSLSIFYCLDGHPKFRWIEYDSDSDSLETGRADASSRVLLVLTQLVVEIVVDWACCVWELVNGIPLRATNDLSGFAVIVFAACAITNISLCCSFYLRAVDPHDV